MASVLSSAYTDCSALGIVMFCVSPAVSLPLIITPIRVLVNKGISCFLGCRTVNAAVGLYRVQSLPCIPVTENITHSAMFTA